MNILKLSKCFSTSNKWELQDKKWDCTLIFKSYFFLQLWKNPLKTGIEPRNGKFKKHVLPIQPGDWSYGSVKCYLLSNRIIPKPVQSIFPIFPSSHPKDRSSDFYEFLTEGNLEEREGGAIAITQRNEIQVST